MHAWSGCDTTSAIYGKGKPSFLKMVQKSEDLQSSSKEMNNYWATQEEISEAAESVFKIVYGEKFKFDRNKVSKFLLTN